MAKGTKKNEDKPKVKTLFDHIRAITRDKPDNYWESLSEADKRTWSNYMVLRFLSMDLDLIGDIAEIQPYVQELKPKHLYKLFDDMIPKSSRYLRYISGDKTNKYEEWLVSLLCNHYNVSRKEASEYLDILYATKEGKAEIKDLAEEYGTDPKLIKKLKLGIK